MNKLSNSELVKINKSARFSPEIVKGIEERSHSTGMSFSQTLEEMASIGVEATSPEIYSKLIKVARVERKEYSVVVKEILLKCLGS